MEETVAYKMNQLDYKINPKKFALWTAIGSICMFFIGLTSAYIVKKGADIASGHWLLFKVPMPFYYSTLIIVLSSGSIFLAKKYFLKGDKKGYQISMLTSSLLGTLFIALQYLGWKGLINIGVYVGGSLSNASGSFFYVLSGAHALHIIGGLLIMYWMTIKAFVRKKNLQSKLGMELISIYWHFVDILWVYLFAMLLFF
jgi:cytochrome c oxidase subunit 3